MKKAVIFFCCLFTLYANEKLFIVERESESLAVIENGSLIDRVENIHNMNHATVKFFDNDGYVISRDGWIVKFNPVNDKKIAEYKTSQSSIGFVVEKNFIAVANYDNKTVEILDRDLKPLQTISTGSKNVGIKTYKNKLVFALMDKDEVWVCENENNSNDMPKFNIVKKFTGVGQVPFDAMSKDNLYIVGFFNSSWLGIIDLDNMTYKKVAFTKDENKPVLKVPHFGFWSIGDDKIFVPSVGESNVMAFDKNFTFLKKIKTSGLPVFTSLSPDKKLLAVTFSGKEFPIVQIIDTTAMEVVKTLTFNGIVLHVRWSLDGEMLYVSVNGENKVDALKKSDWQAKFSVDVKKPSGIFIYDILNTKE